MGKWQTRSLLAAAAVALTSGLATAQVPGGDLTRLVVGQLSPDLRPDAVVLAGDKPILLYGVGIYRASIDISAGVPGTTDLVLIRDGASQLDTVIASHATGLSTLSYNASTGFSWSYIAGSGAWASARRLHEGDLDTDGLEDDLMALDKDGLAILRMRDAVAGRTYLAPAVIPGNSDGAEFTPVNWDASTTPEGWGAAAPEFAVNLESNGIRVIDQGGVNRLTLPVGALGDQIVALHQEGLPFELLVGLVPDGSAGYYQAMSADVTYGVRPIVALGQLYGISGVDAVNWNANGAAEDLVVAHHRDRTVFVLDQQASTNTLPPFDWANASTVIPYDGGSAYTTQDLKTGWPHFADFDNDGTLDVLYAYEYGGTLFGSRNPAVALGQISPTLTQNAPGTTDQGAQTITLNVEAVTTGGAFNPNKLEATVWHKAYDAGTQTYATTASAAQLVQLEDVNATPVVLNVTWPDINDLFFIELRYIRQDTSGALEDAWPSRVILVAETQTARSEIENVFADTLLSDIVVPVTTFTPASTNSRISTSLTASYSIPNFSPNVIPGLGI